MSDDRRLRDFIDGAAAEIAADGEPPEYITMLAALLDEAMVSAGLDPSDLNQRRAIAVGACFTEALREEGIASDEVATAAVLPRVR